jgi:hypothetical protein
MKTLILLLISSVAQADWFCNEASSEVMANEVHACGVAIHPTEGEARSIALEFAIEEFKILCNSSVSCKGRKFDVIPARTECKEMHNGKQTYYKCYRMAKFKLFAR